MSNGTSKINCEYNNWDDAFIENLKRRIDPMDCDNNKYLQIPEELVMWVDCADFESLLNYIPFDTTGNAAPRQYGFSNSPYTGNFINLYKYINAKAIEFDFTCYEVSDECVKAIFNKGFIKSPTPTIPFVVDTYIDANPEVNVDIELPPVLVPGTILPTTVLPSIELPDIVVPDIIVPDINVPDIIIPDIIIPDIVIPDIIIPDIIIPDIIIPDINIPDINIPDIVIPDIVIPDINIPDIPIPDIIIPDIVIPNIVIPDIPIPDIIIPDIVVPDIDIPDFEIPEIDIPTLELPEFNIEIPDIEIPDIDIQLPIVEVAPITIRVGRASKPKFQSTECIQVHSVTEKNIGSSSFGSTYQAKYEDKFYFTLDPSAFLVVDENYGLKASFDYVTVKNPTTGKNDIVDGCRVAKLESLGMVRVSREDGVLDFLRNKLKAAQSDDVIPKQPISFAEVKDEWYDDENMPGLTYKQYFCGLSGVGTNSQTWLTSKDESVKIVTTTFKMKGADTYFVGDLDVSVNLEDIIVIDENLANVMQFVAETVTEGEGENKKEKKQYKFQLKTKDDTWKTDRGGLIFINKDGTSYIVQPDHTDRDALVTFLNGNPFVLWPNGPCLIGFDKDNHLIEYAIGSCTD